jgi:hypothetical protein
MHDGGGFFFDLLYCDECGQTKGVAHKDLGDIHLGFAKGLDHPYAVARTWMDEHIQAKYRGDSLTREEYRAAAEATLDPCTCGGRFRYDAPPRCPTCRSTADMWEPDPIGPSAFYD